MRYRMAALATMSAVLAGCGGGAAPATVSNPARGLRVLTADSAAVDDIAIEAARSLPRGLADQTLFAGVFVNGRKSRTATQAVTRATGFREVSSSRPATVECRRVSSSGTSTPIPCPSGTQSQLPPTFQFDEVRATKDSAYVGYSENTSTSSKANCIVLARERINWRYVETQVIADAKRCGR